MNRNLSKLGAQLLDIWKQLGTSQRVSVLSATLVVVAGLLEQRAKVEIEGTAVIAD